jgi:hypothetical protein
VNVPRIDARGLHGSPGMFAQSWAR